MVNVYERVLKEDEVIPLTYDRIFKLIFGDANHLERLNLLLSVTLKKKVEVIKLYPNDLLDDNRVNKKNEVDLLCKLDGEYVSIEVNTDLTQEVVNRNFAFVSRVPSKDLKPGEEYSNISRYYQINIDIEDFLGVPYEVCHLTGDTTHKRVTARVEFYFINVKHFAEICYNEGGKGLTDFEKLYGMIGTNSKSVIDVLTKDNKILKDIGDMVKKYSSDDELLFYYDREERMLHDAKRKIEDELTKNFKKQLEANAKEVTEKTTLDMVRRMKQEGASLDFISKVTGISIQEIEKM